MAGQAAKAAPVLAVPVWSRGGRGAGAEGVLWQGMLRQVGSGLGDEERVGRRRRSVLCRWRDGGGRDGEVAAEDGDDAAEAGVLEQRGGLERPARERVGPAAARPRPARS